MTSKNSKIELSAFSQSTQGIRFLIFSMGDDRFNSDHRYVWCESLQYFQANREQLEKRYCPNGQLGFLYGCNVGEHSDSETPWAVYSEDCFSPPMYVVFGGDDIDSDLLDIAVEENPGLQYDLEDMQRDYTEASDTSVDQRNERMHKAMDDGIIGTTGQGVFYHSETLNACRMKLIAIELN